jgi:Pellino
MTTFFELFPFSQQNRFKSTKPITIIQFTKNFWKNLNPNLNSFVSGHHDWGQDKASGARRCPMCMEVGPVVTLCMGIEPAFYVDSGPPTYAFNPCGHMATEKTVKWVWMNLLKFQIYSYAPFCLGTGPMWTYHTAPTVSKRSVPSALSPCPARLAISNWFFKTTWIRLN